MVLDVLMKHKLVYIHSSSQTRRVAMDIVVSLVADYGLTVAPHIEMVAGQSMML